MEFVNRLKSNIKYYSNNELNNISINLITNKKTGYENIDNIVNQIGFSETHKHINQINNIMYGGNEGRLEAENDQLNQTVTSLKNKIRQMESNQIAHGVLTDRQNKLVTQQQSINAKERNVRAIETQNKALKESIEKQQASIRTKIEEQRQKEIRLVQKRQEIAQETAREQQLEQQNKALLSQAKQKEQNNITVRNANTALQQKLQTLENKITVNRRQLEAEKVQQAQRENAIGQKETKLTTDQANLVQNQKELDTKNQNFTRERSKHFNRIEKQFNDFQKNATNVGSIINKGLTEINKQVDEQIRVLRTELAKELQTLNREESQGPNDQ
jgi:DNA repair exonuclease SbcCD ATPase subunit